MVVVAMIVEVAEEVVVVADVVVVVILIVLVDVFVIEVVSVAVAEALFFSTSIKTASLASSKNRLVGLVVKASASRAEDPGFESRLRRDFFRGRVIPVTQKLALQWVHCQAPGVIGSALGLVVPVSVYCDWVR